MNITAINPTVISEQVVNVKEVCYGLIGVNLLILTMTLISMNFLAFFYWKKLDGVSLNIGKKTIPLLYLLPVINAMMLVVIATLSYNAF